MRHRLMILGLMALLLTLLPLSAQALTYYVHHTTGLDSRTCTQAQTIGTPKATVTSAFACMGLAEGAGAGHTVVVLTPAGNVNEALLNNWPGGTATASFTLRNGNGGVGATFKPTAAGNGVFDVRNASAHYIVIDGLSVDGTSRGGALVTFNATWSHHNTIKNGEVKNGKGRACIMMGGAGGTNDNGAGGHTNTVENMHVHHCGQERNLDHGIYIPTSNNVVKNSIVHDTCARGIKIDSAANPVEASNNKLLNNIVYRAGAHDPLGDCTIGRNGILVRGLKNEVSGNLIYENVDEGIRLFGNPGRVEDTFLFNNTVVSNGVRGLHIESGTRHVVKNNIFLGNTNNTIQLEAGAAVVASNNTTVGTLTDFFVAPGTDNYLLKSGSPAINAGTASICTSAQVSAGTCWQAKSLSGFSGPAPDQGYAELETGNPAPPLVASYGLNNDLTDGGTLANTCTATSITFTNTAGQFVAGTHAAVFNASTDALVCPHVGLSNWDTATVSMSVRATALSVVQYLVGHSTESPTGNRFSLNTNGTTLYAQVGDAFDLPITTLATGQFYRIVFLVHNQYWKVYINGLVASEGTHTGLATMTDTLTIGNRGTSAKTAGWAGYIDEVRIHNTPLQQTDVDADCALYCVSPPPPPTCPPTCTYSALDLGDGSLSVDGLTATFPLENVTGDGVDPGVCNDLSNFTMSGATLTNCSKTPTTLVLTRAAPPASGAEVITLTVTSPAQTVGVTNNFVPPPTGGADLAMTGYRCRPDVGSDNQPFIGAINTECRMPYQGGTTVHVAIENSGASTAPEQGYALFCIRDPDGTPSASLRVTEECGGTLGLCLNPFGTGLPHGAGAAQSLPVGVGITYQAGGYLIRRDLPASPIVIGIDQQVEFAFALAMDSSVAILQEWSCLVGVDTGIALDAGAAARLKVRAPRVSRR